MTYKEIEENMKNVFESRSANKLQYRYPGATGESYLDLIERVNPIVLQILSIVRASLSLVFHKYLIFLLIDENKKNKNFGGWTSSCCEGAICIFFKPPHFTS